MKEDKTMNDEKFTLEQLRKAMEWACYSNGSIQDVQETLITLTAPPPEPEKSFAEKWVDNVERYAHERGADKISEPHKDCLRREADLITAEISRQIAEFRKEIGK